MFLVSGAPWMGRDSLLRLSDDGSEPNTLTADAAAPTTATNTSAATAAVEREGRPGTTGDPNARTDRLGCCACAPVSCRAVEEAGQEAGRAPKAHWALVGLLWVLAGALCVLGPNGRVLASLAKPALTPKAAASSAPLLSRLSVSPGNGTSNVMPSTAITVSSDDPLERVLVTDTTGA